MRYIIVNERKPKGIPRFCTFCITPIGDSYVRDLQTRCIYHSHFCLEIHEEESKLYIEDAARRVS